MARKSKGIAFLVIGFVLLLIASGWYVYNLAEDNNAGKHAQVLLNEFDKQTKNESVITIQDETFCGKIIIQTLGIELPVYNEWDYTKLKTAPCRYAGNVNANNIIIAAHNYNSHFGNLNRLQIGDEVSFTDASGVKHRYSVKEIKALDGTAVTDMKSGEWDFTLFTCTKSGKQRVTVRCTRINK